MVDFFCEKSSQFYKERMVLEMKIIKQELEFEECLKQRLEFICSFRKLRLFLSRGALES